MTQKYKKVLLILLVVQAISVRQAFGVGVGVDIDVAAEIDIGNKTRVWATNLVFTIDRLLGKRIDDIDLLLREHEDKIFERVGQLALEAKETAVCLEEKANQDLNAGVVKFTDDGLLGLFSKKEKYPACGDYLNYAGNNATLRRSAECVLTSAISNEEPYAEEGIISSLVSMFKDEDPYTESGVVSALASDLSDAYYAAWCTKLHQAGFAGGTEHLYKGHARYAQLSIAWHRLTQIESCEHTGTTEQCYDAFYADAITQIKNEDQRDVANAMKQMALIKERGHSNNIEFNESISDIQFVLNAINVNRQLRELAIKKETSKLLKEARAFKSKVRDYSLLWQQANELCNKNKYSETFALLDTSTPKTGVRKSDLKVEGDELDVSRIALKEISGSTNEKELKEIAQIVNYYVTHQKGWRTKNETEPSQLSRRTQSGLQYKCGPYTQCGKRFTLSCDPNM